MLLAQLEPLALQEQPELPALQGQLAQLEPLAQMEPPAPQGLPEPLVQSLAPQPAHPITTRTLTHTKFDSIS